MPMTVTLSIDTETLHLGDLRKAWLQPAVIAMNDAALERIGKSQQCVRQALGKEQAIYGINTGFGLLASVQVPDDELRTLQENLVLSHSAGTGALLDDRIVRLVLILKILSLGQGYSGVSPELIDNLCALLANEVYPCIPSRGSVGASGDLAPLAHMSSVLLGAGKARHRGEIISAEKALQVAGIEPLALRPKEGLALLNGTQVSTAMALHALFRAEDVFAAACISGALSLDAAQASDTPFDARISRVRNHQGQMDVARLYRDLTAGSAIRASHIDCQRVQDPYCLRCQPQVMGSCLETMRHVAGVFFREACAVTDNPMVFADDDAILSGGNFHAEPIALTCDYLATAIAEIGALSERRIALLIDPNMSGLPPFLVEHSGLNSGFMVPQVTAVALASENKHLASPASIDSMPTSANQEDHVSMAPVAALRLQQMLENCAGIVAIEMLAACQGIEFHRPMKSSATLEASIAKIRSISPPYTTDRMLSEDIGMVRDSVLAGDFLEPAGAILPSAT